MNADAVVIGAGAMGSATAWWLARRGRRVVLFEQFEQGHARGSSHGGTRIFRFAYGDPRYVRMAMDALPLWRELEDDCGEHLVEHTGAYDHGPQKAIDGIAAAMTRSGARFERLTPQAAHERAPGLRFDRDVLFHAEGGRCFADRAVRALQTRAAALGADVRFDCPATLRPAGDGVEVLAAGEAVRAPVAVVTAGAWAAGVVGGHVALPALTVTQEQLVHFPPRDPQMHWPSFIHHVSPWGYGLHTPGEGVKVGGHMEGAVTTADTRTFELDPQLLARVCRYAERWVPGVEPSPLTGTTCLYTTTPDEHFVVERHGPIVVGSPCSGHGFKFTPLIGRQLANLACP